PDEARVERGNDGSDSGPRVRVLMPAPGAGRDGVDLDRCQRFRRDEGDRRTRAELPVGIREVDADVREAPSGVDHGRRGEGVAGHEATEEAAIEGVGGPSGGRVPGRDERGGADDAAEGSTERAVELSRDVEPPRVAVR